MKSVIELELYATKIGKSGSLGKAVIEVDTCSRALEFESWHWILDGLFLYIYSCTYNGILV